jgi:hypothetical protein
MKVLAALGSEVGRNGSSMKGRSSAGVDGLVSHMNAPFRRDRAYLWILTRVYILIAALLPRLGQPGCVSKHRSTLV